jgi:hypothetical protein
MKRSNEVVTCDRLDELVQQELSVSLNDPDHKPVSLEALARAAFGDTPSASAADADDTK